MAYDEDLAHRVRELLAEQDGVSEMSMFGGLAFLLDGNMSVAVSSRGGLMLRVEPDATDEALSRPHARVFEMRGRPVKGWIRVDAEGLRTKRQLAAWVRRGVEFARSLPPKG
jgi:TfoX/Sxy family transcriptional regulator of competence genes